MYEYQVLTFLQPKECEAVLGQRAKEGWRLAAMCPDLAMGVGVIVTLERKAEG
ncbi:hypothetical protein [uncultured Oscillibacter sp.]|uniref:hypothetical protein n=1 Tax=uncultured Oscillibacter sp. TaxID=876091 RepID=UPI0025EDC8E0|nr:hypothetical protein [uncultured Oscillibacter sp.]